MKHSFAFTLATAALSLLVVSCSDNSTSSLRFVTGGEAGTYYAFGSVIAQHITNNTSTKVVALAGNGSQSNIMAMEDGTAELAFSQSDVMAYAYNGTNTFANTGKITCFSTLGALYTEQVQIVTVNPDIKTVADLKGKTVSIGASGSGVYFNAIDILNAYGLSEKDINATYQSFGDSTDALKDGKIDAGFIVAGAPTNAITDLSTTRKVSLVSLDEEHIAALIAKSAYYSKATIAKETYNMNQDVQTVAVGAVVLVRNDTPTQTVRAICADIFDNASSLTSSHAKYGEVSLQFGASVTTVPYHPGAAEYFASKGITVHTATTQK